MTTKTNKRKSQKQTGRNSKSQNSRLIKDENLLLKLKEQNYLSDEEILRLIIILKERNCLSEADIPRFILKLEKQNCLIDARVQGVPAANISDARLRIMQALAWEEAKSQRKIVGSPTNVKILCSTYARWTWQYNSECPQCGEGGWGLTTISTIGEFPELYYDCPGFYYVCPCSLPKRLQKPTA